MKNNNEKWSEILQIILFDVIKAWRFILTCVLLFGIGADIILTLTTTPLYKSDATFAIKTNNQYATSENIDEISDISSAFGYIISSNVFKNDVKNDMGVDSLDGYFTTSVLENTNIIKISAVASSPKLAYEMMNSMLDRYQDLSQLVMGNVNIELMQNISIPTRPFNKVGHMANFMRFAFVGGVLSIALVALLSYFSDTVKTQEDMEVMQVKQLGSIPKESKIYRTNKWNRKKSILISQLSTSFAYIEEIKRLRFQVEKSCEKHGYKTIMITSSLENEEKSSVLSNLGLALAENNKKVLLVDCDLRKPALHKIFDKKSNNGIRLLLDGKTDLKRAIVRDPSLKVDFLLGLDFVKDADEKVDSVQLKRILEEAKLSYDYILVDSVPSALFTDTISLAKLCDACILVVRQNFISVKIISSTLEKLHLSHTKVMGYVMNQKLPTLKATSGLYGGYEYRYGRYGYGRRTRGEADGKRK